MPITLTNPITVPQQTANKLWVLNLSIIAPDPSKPVIGVVSVCPMTDAGALILEQKKNFTIPNVLTAAATDSDLANAVNAIYTAVQSRVAALNLYP